MKFSISSMNRLLGGALALSTVLLVTSANGASDTGTATATVIAPIAISNTTDLAFGKFAASTGGTVIINATTGGRSKTGAVVLSTTGSTQNAGEFDITGDSGATYAITLPADSTVTIDDAGAGDPMAVDTFTSDPSGTGTLTGGAETVKVGATLAVANAQLAGAYTGTYSVTVEYN